jgi:hypothetical protein
MNNNYALIHDFVNKIRQTIDSLSLEVSKSPVDVKESFVKIRQTKNDLTHIYNLLKIEESLQQIDASNR